MAIARAVIVVITARAIIVRIIPATAVVTATDAITAAAAAVGAASRQPDQYRHGQSRQN